VVSLTARMGAGEGFWFSQRWNRRRGHLRYVTSWKQMRLRPNGRRIRLHPVVLSTRPIRLRRPADQWDR